MKASEKTRCSICDGETVPVIDMPALPLTGIYREGECDRDFPRHEQSLLLCELCGHGQLRYALDSETLYDRSYGFRTSTSLTASGGSRYFAEFLERCLPGVHFSRVVEFGCNDTYLLNLLAKRAGRLLGVDPILRGSEESYRTDQIEVIGDIIEAVDFDAVLGGKPDLIISQHTLEHLDDPRSVLESLLHLATNETIFVMELPCFDPLLENYRFDQVFHQHLQYFSLRSFCVLLERLGAEVLYHGYNYLYWGAMLIVFRKGRTQTPTMPTLARHAEVLRRYEIFKQSMHIAARMLEDSSGQAIYGYGAALMLPILGYHLGTDFSNFVCILDDDPQKEGLGYANLPVRIQLPRDVDYETSTFCLTAMDNRRPILRNLIEKRPRRLINPLGAL